MSHTRPGTAGGRHGGVVRGRRVPERAPPPRLPAARRSPAARFRVADNHSRDLPPDQEPPMTDPNPGPRHEPERVYERAADPAEAVDRPLEPKSAQDELSVSDDDADRASGTRGSGGGADADARRRG
jgi:hypothetical protein